MPYPNTWNDVLEAPSFIINLDRRPERWSQSFNEVQKAGFKNIQRWHAVDYKNKSQCDEAYTLLGHPPKHPSFNNDFQDYPGTWGVFLSQTTLWKKIVDEHIPYACIFEDDVLFHSQWEKLAPVYFENTTQEYDILFMGSQFEFRSEYHIDKGPVFCLHAYMVTYEGAKQLLDYVMSTEAGGIYTIDTMLKVAMEWKEPPFRWLVWNAFEFPCERANMTTAWRKRNQGLVFQDERMGTDIRVYKD